MNYSEKNEYNKLGRIAKTYDELHGIHALTLAYQKNKPELPTERLIRTLLQCIELTYLNLTEICERQIEIRRIKGWADSLPRRTTHIAWHASLLRIAVYLASITNSKINNHVKNDGTSWVSSSRQQYNNIFEKLSTLDIQDIESYKQKFHSAISTSTSLTPLAAFIHRTGEVLHLRSILSVRLAQITKNITTSNSDIFLNFNQLHDAFSKPKIASDQDTYYSQFKLMHQIPELIALDCIERINEIEFSRNSPISMISFLIEFQPLLRVIVDCLQPLIQLLAPLEYYRIRENLGATSGSQSKNLAQKLLKKDFALLRRLVNAMNKEDPLFPIIHSLFTETESTIFLWLDFHLTLPRGLLAGHGTASLMGHNDGFGAALKFRDRFANANKHLQLTGITGDEYLATESLDDLLRKLISTHVQSSFKDVQTRSGFYKDYPFKEV